MDDKIFNIYFLIFVFSFILFNLSNLFAGEYVGNQSIAGIKPVSPPINSLNLKYLSFSFTAPKDGVIDLIMYPVANVIGSPNYKIGIMGDDGNGKPNNIWLSYTFYNSFSPNSWATINISSTTLVKDKVYHIVIDYNGMDSNYITTVYTLPRVNLIPENQIEDNNLNYIEWSSNSWNVKNYMPIFLIKYSDGFYHGNSIVRIQVENIRKW